MNLLPTAAVAPLGFNALAGAWLFTLLAPIVLFYFLKLKRPRVEIPSLVLWRQVLRDNRVNSPFQKFKRNLLLLLQLILLSLLALAAMQPFWRGRPERLARLPVLIDCSASMAAVDEPGGKTRLERAKDEVRKLIDEMLPDQELCIIAFHDSARKVIGFTGNKRRLRSALDGITVEDVPSNIEDALRMTQALSLGAAFEDVVLLSDGNFPLEADFELSFKLDYRRLDLPDRMRPGRPGPRAPANIGITSLSARRTERNSSSGEGWDVFVRVEATPGVEDEATLKVASRGEEPITRRVDLAGGGAARTVFRLPGDSPVGIRLVPGGFDALQSDNAAFIDLPAVRPLWVYVASSDALEAFRYALKAHPNLRLFSDRDPGAAGALFPDEAYDLVITDRPEDQDLYGQVCLYLGVVPENLKELVTVAEEGTEVVDWDRAALLLQHVELRDLITLERPESAEGVRVGDYESRGYHVLVHGRSGPLVLEGRREEGGARAGGGATAFPGATGERRLFYFLFHPSRSTLPYRVGFPILIANALRMAMFQTGLAEVQGARTGVLPPIQLAPNARCKATGPDRGTWEAVADPAGVLRGVPARRVGYYQIAATGGETRSIGAGLLDSGETSLAGVDTIEFNEGLAVEAVVGVPKADRSLWRWLGLLAFGVMLVEWWYFQRRP